MQDRDNEVAIQEIQKPTLMASRILGDQANNLLEILKTKGLVDLAAKIPEGNILVERYLELKESGNKKIPEIHREMYTEGALSSFIVARYSQAMCFRLINEIDPDDTSVLGQKKERLYALFLNGYAKATDTMIKCLRSLGYEGSVSVVSTFAEMASKLLEEESEDMKSSREEEWTVDKNG